MPKVTLFNAYEPITADRLDRDFITNGKVASDDNVGKECFRYGEYIGDTTKPIAPTEDDERAAQEIIKNQKLVEQSNSGKQISDLVERFICIDTQPFRFHTEWTNPRTRQAEVHDRGYLKYLYNLAKDHPQGCRNQIWHTGRQVEKSSSQSAKSIVLGRMFPAYKSLYVAPRFDQVTIFSNQRFKPMAEDSKALVADGTIKPRSNKHIWQVGQKEFMNRSFFNFRSCYMTADGCRGISAHHLMIDEIQDIVSDNIPVLEECQSHYGWETGLRFRTYAGTPKTNNNALTSRYRESSQFEWLIKCSHCSFWNFPDAQIIGKTCYICTKCGKGIDPHREGRWVPLNPAKLDECWGFRIPQMIVPFKKHDDIYSKMIDPNISPLRFHNEVLGLPYDEGEIVLTEQDIRKACNESRTMWTPGEIYEYSRVTGTVIFGGVDYGTGEGDHPSFTVLTIGCFDMDGTFKVMYMKKFFGKDAGLSGQPALINTICRDAKVRYLMADWGFGAQNNARLCDEYGWDWVAGEHVLMQAMYVKQRQKAKFDHVSFKYLLDRNANMASFIDVIRKTKVKFDFNFLTMKQFCEDFTTIYIEYNELYGTTKYDHVKPDDSFHAANYCYMAGLQFFGRLVDPNVPNIDEVDPESLGYI